MPTVYPRAYGGTLHSRVSEQHAKGLSPRVRGNRDKDGYFSAALWSIPARTGEPDAVKTFVDCFEVYPRAYGGTVWL